MKQINDSHNRSRRAAEAGLVCLLIVCAGSLTGCGRGSRAVALTADPAVTAPVQLNAVARAPEKEVQKSVLMTIDPAQAKRAINNLRINLRRKAGPYQFAAADLNGDGIAEIIVLFTGKKWCAKTGCTLAVLSPDNHRYRAISQVLRVKTPVRIGTQSSNGWRDLIVKTGGGGLAVRYAALKFSASGYPANATLLPVLSSSAAFDGEVAIAPPSSPNDVAVGR